MSSIEPDAAATLDPYLDAVIARAEASRTMLERLAVIGMEMAEAIRERHVQAPSAPSLGTIRTGASPSSRAPCG
jgi:hypothetical protein